MRTPSSIARTLTRLAPALLLIGGLVGPSTAVGAEKIRITVPAVSVALAALYHAKGAGVFAEEGLGVEIALVAGGGALQALIARDAQFAAVPGTYQMMAYEKGQPLLAVLSISNRNVINVVMHRDVARERGITEKTPLAERFKALKGLKLSGTAVGSFSHQVLMYYVLKAGLDPQKDVTIIGIGAGPPMLLALEQRKVDVFATGTPIPEAAILRGLGVLIVDNSAGEDPDFAEFAMNLLMVHPEYARQHPEVVRKTTRALLRSTAWVLDHSAEEAVPVMKPFIGGLDERLIIAGLQKARLGMSRDGRITERAVTLTQEFLRRIGHLKTTIPYDKLVTTEFLLR